MHIFITKSIIQICAPQYITTIIDPAILADPYGAQIESTHSIAGISSKTTTATRPHYPTAGSITWQRSVLRTLTETITVDENYVLLVWPASMLLTRVQDFDQQHDGAGRPPAGLIVYGLAAHVRRQRGGAAVIAAQQIDREIQRMELRFGIAHRRCETAADLALVVLMFTKSVADAPYKLEKSRKHDDELYYTDGENVDTVSVLGNVGLGRLWQHQLCLLPMATLATAEAIIEAYPMPRLLLDAYDESNDGDGGGGAELLSNLPVRRSAGPSTHMRNVGTKLSKRMYDLFTNDDPELTL